MRVVEDDTLMTRPLIRQTGGGLAQGVEDAFDVDGEEPVELVVGDVLQLFVEHDPGVVDQDVEPAEVIEGGVEEGFDLLGIADVGLDGDGPAPGFFDGGDGGVGVVTAGTVVDDHACPGRGEGAGDGGPDAAGGAGDEGDFVLQAGHERGSAGGVAGREGEDSNRRRSDADSPDENFSVTARRFRRPRRNPPLIRAPSGFNSGLARTHDAALERNS